MAKRRKYRRRKKYDYEPLELNLHPQAKKAICVIILLAIGALGILSFFKVAGQFGIILDNALAVVFGSLRLVFAISLIVLAGLVYLGRGVKILTYVGLLLFYCSLGGLVHLIAYHDTDLIVASQLGQGGGYVGLFLSYPLLQAIGFAGAVLINIALLLISLVITFNTSIEAILKIFRFIGGFLYNLIKNLFALIANKEISPFEKREVDDEYDEEESDEDEYEAEQESEPQSAPATKAPAGAKATIIKKRRKIVPVPLALLSKKTGKANAGDIKNNMNIIQRTFRNFGIDVDMGPHCIGPTVTQYTLKPREGIKLSRITGLSNDLALELAAHPIRMEAPIPGKSLVGIEVPNQNIAIVNLRDVLGSAAFKKEKGNLVFTLGKDVAGKVWTADLAKMPHLLVAGSTGSGKSVCLHSIILSLLYSHGPNDLKFIMVDAKRVELPPYNGIPHLLTPVITDAKKTINSLKWAISEMERRYDVLSKTNRRDIKSYNSVSRDKMPYIIIIIDELADLMAAAGAELEACIIKLAQKSRAVGIHLILATQRPDKNIVTGLIKANIPARIAFAVQSIINSRIILDHPGAEKLLGRGDMLFLTPEISKPKRLQGAYVAEGDIKKVAGFLKKNYDEPDYNEEVLEKQKTQLANGMSVNSEDSDPLLEDAIDIIMNAGKASASLLQRRLSVGYARAARLLDILEDQGIIGPADGAKPREILKKKEDLQVAETPLHEPSDYTDDEEEYEDENDDDEEEEKNEDEENFEIEVEEEDGDEEEYEDEEEEK